MKVSSKKLKRIIHEELSLLMEGCGEVEVGESECSACAAGHECPCDDEEPLGDGVEDGESLFSKEESLRVVLAVAQNTSCPVTRAALLDVVEDLGSGEGEEWDLEASEHENQQAYGDTDVDISWSNPQYGHFRGDVDDLESKDDAFGTGFAMGQSGDFPERHG